MDELAQAMVDNLLNQFAEAAASTYPGETDEASLDKAGKGKWAQEEQQTMELVREAVNGVPDSQEYADQCGEHFVGAFKLYVAERNGAPPDPQPEDAGGSSLTPPAPAHASSHGGSALPSGLLRTVKRIARSFLPYWLRRILRFL